MFCSSQSLQVLWKAQVLLQGIIDCEAYCSGWHNFDVVQAQASKKGSEALLPDNHAQTLQSGPYLLSLLLGCSALRQVLQPLHLQMITAVTRMLPCRSNGLLSLSSARQAGHLQMQLYSSRH